MPQEDKVAAINMFKEPKTVKQLQSFLGLASYYRKFIQDFSKIASPSYKATEKRKRFKWPKECEQAFDKLKSTLTSDALLIFPDFNKVFRLETDTSDFGLGGVLTQKREGGWKPIAYCSKHLSKADRNYSTTVKPSGTNG